MNTKAVAVVIMISIFIFFGNTPLHGALISFNQKTPQTHFPPSSHIWMVDNEGDGDFTSIQKAIDAADNGDTIIVFSGTYTENIDIGKDALIIEGKDYELGLGDDNGKPIIKPVSTEKAINFICDDTDFSGFIIEPSPECNLDIAIGIYSSYNRIHNNSIYNADYAFYLYSVEKNSISWNHIQQTQTGFYLFDASENTITSNNCTTVNQGCYISESHDNTMVDNTFFSQTMGIVFEYANNNELRQNNIIESETGISLQHAQSNTFWNNTLSKNNEAITLYASTLNTFQQNSILQNTQGLLLSYGSNGNNISQNTIAYTMYTGIYLSGSSTNTIYANTIKFNTDAVVLSQSTYNTLLKNIIQSNNKGIYLHGSRLCFISQNKLTANTQGIFLNYTNDNEITQNNISSYQFGESILIQNSYDEIITKNTILNAGISLYSSQDIALLENSISNTLDGMYFKDSIDNSIIANTIISSKFNGVSLNNKSTNNLFYHNNFINNNQHATEESTNQWDNGYPSGGNYWDDYKGSDINNDGRGDTPYEIPGGNNIDAYPLMFLWGAPEKPDRPEGPSTGKIGTTYTYYTHSIDPNSDRIQFGWDWNGDKRVDEWTPYYESGTEASITHSWQEDGEFAVYVKAIDLHGVESEWSEPLQITMPKTDETKENIALPPFIYHKITGILKEIIHFPVFT